MSKHNCKLTNYANYKNDKNYAKKFERVFSILCLYKCTTVCKVISRGIMSYFYTAHPYGPLAYTCG